MLRGPCQRIAASLLGVSSFRSIAAAQQRLPAQQLIASSSGDGAVETSSSVRGFAADAGDYTAEVDAINEKFVEAREEIEYAREDAETVYFNESAEVARKAVGDVLERWQTLLARLPEDEQAKLQRSMGLKIEQLRAELKEMDELHA